MLFAALMDVPTRAKEEEVHLEEIVDARIFLYLFLHFNFTFTLKNTYNVESHPILTFPNLKLTNNVL
jgi:hypothetical protein